MEIISAEFQWIGGLVFAVSVSFLAAWSRFNGKKDGPAQPKVHEFALSGQLADMGPVKELMEQTGLLVQQQVRTNIHLEATAKALSKFADTYAHRIEDEQREKDIAEEVARQLKGKG
jgi:hypothetical protein